METNQEDTEQLEIELDDETSAIAHMMAEKRGISVEQLLHELLSDAIENGYFNNTDNVTVDDPLD